MAKHKVRQGQCLSSIANAYGFSNWKKIYYHAENTNFRIKRPNPNVIYPGDSLFVPNKETKQEPGSTETRHRFRVAGTKIFLRIVVLNELDEPFANCGFQLELENEAIDGFLDEEGLLDVKIPAQATKGKLTVEIADGEPPPTVTWSLQIGRLDPVEEVSGVQARLNNLGFDCGDVDGIVGPLTRESIELFQAEYEVQDQGLGQATRDKLVEIHGC